MLRKNPLLYPSTSMLFLFCSVCLVFDFGLSLPWEHQSLFRVFTHVFSTAATPIVTRVVLGVTPQWGKWIFPHYCTNCHLRSEATRLKKFHKVACRKIVTFVSSSFLTSRQQVLTPDLPSLWTSKKQCFGATGHSVHTCTKIQLITVLIYILPSGAASPSRNLVHCGNN